MPRRRATDCRRSSSNSCSRRAIVSGEVKTCPLWPSRTQSLRLFLLDTAPTERGSLFRDGAIARITLGLLHGLKMLLNKTGG
eukprot:454813-Alexandrium_andersonii.AAC.1